MQNKEKVALFDFCETIANFQTGDAYINYVRNQTGNKLMKRKASFRVLLHKLWLIPVLSLLFPRLSVNKRLVLWQLKGFSKSELDSYAKAYYENVVRLNLIPEVVEELKRLQKDHWRILIVSAGYEIYLKYFCEDFGIPQENLIAVKIKFNNDKCAGTFDGGDRLWDKTQKLDELFDRNRIYSVAYSDSISDLLMLQWANEGIVVRSADRNNWADKYHFKQIVWKK